MIILMCGITLIIKSTLRNITSKPLGLLRYRGSIDHFMIRIWDLFILLVFLNIEVILHFLTTSMVVYVV